ncbi:MAG: hypothetical protein ACMG6S_36265, partial [Byssovorax sp.]
RSPAARVVRRVTSAIARAVPAPKARARVPKARVPKARVPKAIGRVVRAPTALVRVATTGRVVPVPKARPSLRPGPRRDPRLRLPLLRRRRCRPS